MERAVMNAVLWAPSVVWSFGHQCWITLDTNRFRDRVLFAPISPNSLRRASQCGELRDFPIVAVAKIEYRCKANENQGWPDAAEDQRYNPPNLATRLRSGAGRLTRTIIHVRLWG